MRPGFRPRPKCSARDIVALSTLYISMFRNGVFTRFGLAACRRTIYFLFVSKVISGYSREGPFSKGDFLSSRYSPKKAST